MRSRRFTFQGERVYDKTRIIWGGRMPEGVCDGVQGVGSR